ncbi:hypothetical protein C0Q70_05224 [Pomacea canaliculata]|uniref:Sulfatase N-terminal domain-containing protein n=1 Tax=Pomacea canaliculata TaxID=400727 RepID=A0A2T7PKN7_POMCA|nr:hypothetical protein C0Q70_05224 [Pomacea canaliculata]
MSVKKLKECDRLSLALSDMKLPTRLVLLALTVMLVLVMLLVLSSIGAVDKARSRASFMTGYYAFRTGLQHIPIIHFKTMYLPSRFTLLPELLKRQGYATHVVGKSVAMLFARRAVEIIDNHNPKKPLFLYLPLQAVHSPIENGATPEYAGNNWPLRGGKFSLWEGGTRVPGFVYSRTLLKKTGYTSNELIHAVDWFPTILHLAGKSAGDHVDGLNLWRTLSEGEPSPRTEFVYNIDEVDQNAAIRMGDYKLIVGEPGRFNDWYPLPQNGTPLPEEYPLWKLGRFQKLFPEYQLYNVKDDPTEKNDLAEEHPELVQTMLQRLKRYQRLVVPSQNPGVSAASLPHNFGGVWSPGWC